MQAGRSQRMQLLPVLTGRQVRVTGHDGPPRPQRHADGVAPGKQQLCSMHLQGVLPLSSQACKHRSGRGGTTQA